MNKNELHYMLLPFLCIITLKWKRNPSYLKPTSATRNHDSSSSTTRSPMPSTRSPSSTLMKPALKIQRVKRSPSSTGSPGSQTASQSNCLLPKPNDIHVISYLHSPCIDTFSSFLYALVGRPNSIDSDQLPGLAPTIVKRLVSEAMNRWLE